MKNPFFNKAKRRAKEIFGQPEKVKQVLDDATKRSKLIDTTKEKAATFSKNLQTLFSMLKAYFKGDYKDLPKNTIIKLLGAVIYFLFIADLIPDFFAVIGLVDDAAVVAWVINSISEDLDRFRQWELAQNEPVDVEDA
ncbi:MAG: DUF1232 domain-containing protein [Saprospiraceae bacterium]|nr:DUF1232 domain-containing protein [Saprospiraceae bacterium]